MGNHIQDAIWTQSGIDGRPEPMFVPIRYEQIMLTSDGFLRYPTKL